MAEGRRSIHSVPCYMAERQALAGQTNDSNLDRAIKAGARPCAGKIPRLTPLKAAPIPAEVREFTSRLKAKTRTADTARAF